MPWQLQENADITMARANTPCEELQGHRALVHASPGAISNPLQLLLRATPGTTRLKLIICIREILPFILWNVKIFTFTGDPILPVGDT